MANYGSLNSAMDLTLLRREILVPIVAHSLRNPLNAIRGAITFIKEEYSDHGNLIDFTEIIEDEIERLETIISQLLSSSFSFKVDRRYANINDLLKGIEMATSVQALSKNIETSYEYNEIPRVKIDAFQMEQAIRNIVNNAIEAMPKGGRLKVKTGIESGNIFIEVRDTGMGVHGRLFSPGGSPGNNGRGLGLYIARQILSVHNGKLIIRTRESEGTIVRMLIPFRSRVI